MSIIDFMSLGLLWIASKKFVLRSTENVVGEYTKMLMKELTLENNNAGKRQPRNKERERKKDNDRACYDRKYAVHISQQ